MPSNFYRCFRHEICCSEDCSKTEKFWAKTTSHGNRSGNIDDVQRRSRFAQKGHNCWQIMGAQCPIILMEASRKAKTEKSMSSSVTVFFDSNVVVHHEFLLQGHMVNKKYYLEVKRRLREAIHQKRTELWKNQSWILYHDNALALATMLVREFLVKNKTVIIPQPPYSPHLIRADIFSIQNWRHRWKECLWICVKR